MPLQVDIVNGSPVQQGTLTNRSGTITAGGIAITAWRGLGGSPSGFAPNANGWRPWTIGAKPTPFGTPDYHLGQTVLGLALRAA